VVDAELISGKVLLSLFSRNYRGHMESLKVKWGKASITIKLFNDKGN
jgi:hypothetical protein